MINKTKKKRMSENKKLKKDNFRAKTDFEKTCKIFFQRIEGEIPTPNK